MDALILAGKKDSEKIESCCKLTNKALLMLNEIPMIEYIVNALLQSKEIKDIVVVGPEYDLSQFLEKKVTKIIESTDSIIENIKIGLDYFNNNGKILLLTSDIPLITGEIIDRFIKKCEPFDAFFYYPIISQEVILKKFPDANRTYFTLKEGVFCGGNMVLFSPVLFEKNKELANELYQNRKDVTKYVSLLGAKLLVKYFMKKLSIKEIEEKAEHIVGFPVKSITIEDPEVMIDLDKLSDYELILQTINQTTPNSSS